MLYTLNLYGEKYQLFLKTKTKKNYLIFLIPLFLFIFPLAILIYNFKIMLYHVK